MASTENKGDAPAGRVVDLETGKAVDREEVKDVYVPQPARVFQVEGNDVRGFTGVDPEYMNYADVTGAPILSEAEENAYEESQKVREEQYKEMMEADEEAREEEEQESEERKEAVRKASLKTAPVKTAPAPASPSPTK